MEGSCVSLPSGSLIYNDESGRRLLCFLHCGRQSELGWWQCQTRDGNPFDKKAGTIELLGSKLHLSRHPSGESGCIQSRLIRRLTSKIFFSPPSRGTQNWLFGSSARRLSNFTEATILAVVFGVFVGAGVAVVKATLIRREL